MQIQLNFSLEKKHLLCSTIHSKKRFPAIWCDFPSRIVYKEKGEHRRRRGVIVLAEAVLEIFEGVRPGEARQTMLDAENCMSMLVFVSIQCPKASCNVQ